MQLMNTVFLLITSIINRIYSEIKIINSIFKFNIQDSKIMLKLNTFKDKNKILNPKNIRNFDFSSKKLYFNQPESDNKSKNHLILKSNDYTNISSLNFSDFKKFQDKRFTINLSKNKNTLFYGDNIKNAFKSKIENIKNEKKAKNPKENSEIKNKEHIYMEFNEPINLSVLDYLCPCKNSKKSRHIKLYNQGNQFYRKKMDVVHVFTLLTILEDFIQR